MVCNPDCGSHSSPHPHSTGKDLSWVPPWVEGSYLAHGYAHCRHSTSNDCLMQQECTKAWPLCLHLKQLERISPALVLPFRSAEASIAAQFLLPSRALTVLCYWSPINLLYANSHPRVCLPRYLTQDTLLLQMEKIKTREGKWLAWGLTSLNVQILFIVCHLPESYSFLSRLFLPEVGGNSCKAERARRGAHPHG